MPQVKKAGDLTESAEFTIHQGALYLCSMPKGETKDLLLFMVPMPHCVATLNGCHRDATIPCLCYGSVVGFKLSPSEGVASCALGLWWQTETKAIDVDK